MPQQDDQHSRLHDPSQATEERPHRHTEHNRPTESLQIHSPREHLQRRVSLARRDHKGPRNPRLAGVFAPVGGNAEHSRRRERI